MGGARLLVNAEPRAGAGPGAPERRVRTALAACTQARALGRKLESPVARGLWGDGGGDAG